MGFKLFRSHLRILMKGRFLESNIRIQRNLFIYNNKLYKVFQETENSHAFEFMKRENYLQPLTMHHNDHDSMQDFNLDKFLVEQNWKTKADSELLNIFKSLSSYCGKNNIPITKSCFDTFIDNLTDKVKNLSDDQLAELFYALKCWPETPSAKTRNFVEVWAALDDECCNRCNEWNNEKRLQFLSYTYALNITKLCDYTTNCLNRLATKAKCLTPSELVQVYFYIGILRKAPFDMHNLEVMIRDDITQFTLEDLAIIAMGMFKSRTPMRSMELLHTIIEKIISNSDTVNEITLAALLKLLRYSLKFSKDNLIYRLLDSLKKQVTRLSLMCCVHIAHLSSTTLTLHETCLDAIALKCLNDIEKARLKDLERLVLTFSVFNYEPKIDKNFFENVINELGQSEREREIKTYGSAYSCCVSYLTLLNYFPFDHINKILDLKFLKECYGTPFLYGREILHLDNSLEIQCPNYRGNRLPSKIVIKLAKKYTDYIPDTSFKKEFNISDRTMLDIMRTLRVARGGESYVCGDHVLPHYQRGDIIFCDDQNGNKVEVAPHYPTEPFGLIKKPPNDNNYWYVLIVAGRNAYIRNTNQITGPMYVKLKQLHILGYFPAFVDQEHWNTLGNQLQKMEYIDELLENAKKNHII